MAYPAGSIRLLLRRVHLWLAVPLGLLLVVISLSGSALVWRDHADRLINHGRYAVSGDTIALPLSTYISNAATEAGVGPLPVRLTLPENQGWPIRVELRGTKADGKSSRFVTAFLDPATGKVLDVVDVSSTLIGFLHNLHHMLNVPQYSGRQIVGWLGIFLIVLAVSGLFLWWPRNNDLRYALRWRRSTQVTFNLHNLFGVIIALPLIAVCLTGVYLSFPQTAAAFMSSLANHGGTRSHGYGAMPLPSPQRKLDDVVQLAKQDVADSRLLTIHFPNSPSGDGHAQHTHPEWRVELRKGNLEDTMIVAIDDVTGRLRQLPPAQTGDVAVKWIEWIHEGRRASPVWPILAFVSGLAPLVFFVTGLVMWMRRRARSNR